MVDHTKLSEVPLTSLFNCSKVLPKALLLGDPRRRHSIFSDHRCSSHKTNRINRSPRSKCSGASLHVQLTHPAKDSCHHSSPKSWFRLAAFYFLLLRGFSCA